MHLKTNIISSIAVWPYVYRMYIYKYVYIYILFVEWMLSSQEWLTKLAEIGLL